MVRRRPGAVTRSRRLVNARLLPGSAAAPRDPSKSSFRARFERADDGGHRPHPTTRDLELLPALEPRFESTLALGGTLARVVSLGVWRMLHDVGSETHGVDLTGTVLTEPACCWGELMPRDDDGRARIVIAAKRHPLWGPWRCFCSGSSSGG